MADQEVVWEYEGRIETDLGQAVQAQCGAAAQRLAQMRSHIERLTQTIKREELLLNSALRGIAGLLAIRKGVDIDLVTGVRVGNDGLLVKLKEPAPEPEIPIKEEPK